LTLRFHPAVQTELSHLVAWYEERSEGLAAELRDEVERALGRIVEQPHRWAPSPLPMARALGVRRFVIDRFPLAVEYVVETESIYVVAVAHTKRRPGYWLRRIALTRKPPRRK
jgi:plasmid stabilization system protein ParE